MENHGGSGTNSPQLDRGGDEKDLGLAQGEPTRTNSGGKAMSTDQWVKSKKLTAEEILGLAPRDLLLHLIWGVKRKYDFSISFMLDVPQNDKNLSMGTGYEFITDEDTFEEICKFLRKHDNVAISGRCPEADLWGFNRAKEMVRKKKEKYLGESYFCGSVGLLDFAVPLYESESDSFIGVLFGCQKRPRGENVRKAFCRLRELVSADENKMLAQHFWKIFRLYLKVKKADQGEIERMMETCRSIGRNITDRFKFYIQQKQHEIKRVQREKAIGSIQKRLVNAETLDDFWGSMRENIDDLASWLPFDWCVVLWRLTGMKGELRAELGVVARSGRGLPPTDRLLEDCFEGVGIPEIAGVAHGGRVEGMFEDAVRRAVSREAESWAFPFHGETNEFVGCMIFGSAPEHHHSVWDGAEVDRRYGRIIEVINTMSLKYRGLAAARALQRREKQLLGAQKEQERSIARLEQTLLSLNHQLHRPLFMIRGALSNVRDMYLKDAKRRDRAHIELGMDIAEQSAVLCRGLASILAVEQGGKLQGKIKKIEVKHQIRLLAEAMRRAQHWTDKSFKFFYESPIIEMNELSFLFIFYALIDNALKYAAPYSQIEIGFSVERKSGKHAFKVKSKGLPIAPEDTEKVFEKFWRDPKAQRYDELGLGIGCWAAREHMRECGGNIYLEVSGDLSVFVVVPPIEMEFG